MIRALLVDDETPARARLRKLLGAHLGIEIIGEATNGLQALEKIEELKPDLVFLDIEMPELDGLEVARNLGDAGPFLIFVTAYDEFALKAFETHAVDYLLKPVAEARLKVAIEKVQKRQKPNFSEILSERSLARIGVKSGNRYIVVELARVSSIVAKDHYSAIQIDGRELLADEPLDSHEKKLDPAKFLRVHRSAIINIDFVKELEREGDRKFVVVLSDCHESRIPISRERLDAVRKKLNL
jgi:two-component system LytT family response regulator